MKIGHPECSDEARQCIALGSEVCPQIYAVLPDRYFMERLEQTERNGYLIALMHRLLREKVWSRPPVAPGRIWRPAFEAKYGFAAPDWVDESECLTHGDPTVSNALRRGQHIVLCDPAPRPYVPEYASVDRGRLLQSLLGYECEAHGEPWVDFEYRSMTDAWSAEQTTRAVFWLAVSVRGIVQREMRSEHPRTELQNWCYAVQSRCEEVLK